MGKEKSKAATITLYNDGSISVIEHNNNLCYDASKDALRIVEKFIVIANTKQK